MSNFIAERRNRIAAATEEEKTAVVIAYKAHREQCRKYEIPPQDFVSFVDEWLTVERKKSPEPAVDEDHRRFYRDGWKQFEGKRGYDWK